MSAARHHAEWLSLVETSGPFLSMPVLMRVFPQGLEQRNPAKASKLREAYEDWLESGGKKPAVHHAWVRHVLEKLLDYPPEFLAEGQAIPPGMEATMSNFAETLRPDFVLKHRDAGHAPLLLIEHYPREQDLEKPVAGKLWKASPGTRMMELLHAADVPLGLVTNGEQWMLVYAPRGETTGFASWYADLWMQEPITLRAFHSLLHLRRFLGVAEPETLAGLYAASSKDQQEVTDQLGYQVRQAVEMLVQAFDRIDAESGRTLLADVSEKALYDSALTVMMRLVFLFSADERGLLLLGDPLYDQHYAVSTLSELLRERADQHGEEILGHRHDAWCRLLATFRAVHAGVEHEAMRLPPYGGTLFDPNRYPFLEGRAADTQWQTTPAKPLLINNRVVLHLLEALQVLRVKVTGGGPTEARRLSFRALDIEQIGHVYEGLLDHTAKRAGEVILGLAGSKNSEPEIPLSELEGIAAKGTDVLVEFLKEETGRSEKALGKALENTGLVDGHALLIACGQDPRLEKRVRPFAPLVREDDFGQMVVIMAGSIYVTRGSDRRSTGTHYTPRSLTEPIVQHTLEPLVYIGPAEGKPRAEWKLRSAREILAIKVCDMAMGSGAFLVQCCRYLAERLVEAWEIAEKANPGQFIATPDGELSSGDPSERLIPADPAERLAIARRYVADRCLYGVDINPMAVEMAKLSLWLITLQRDRPFTFLDHALKCGDSLLGVSSVQQIENFSLRPGDRQVTFATANLFRYVEEASVKRRALEDLPSNDHTQIETKTRLHAEAEAATAKVKALADALIAFEMRGLDGNAYEEQLADEAEKVQLLMKRDADAGIETSNPESELARAAREALHGRRTFHWPVEFPEVFARGGFDVFAGNPPFLGGRRISFRLGESYYSQLQALYPWAAGTTDLCVYFLRRACSLLRDKGLTGFVLSDIITQGDSRESGLVHLCASGFRIICGQSSRHWPGTAGVKIVDCHMFKGTWEARANFDAVEVDAISSHFRPEEQRLDPLPLEENQGVSFSGHYLMGQGFLVTPDEAETLIQKNQANADVIFDYIKGDELNNTPHQTIALKAINFGFRDLPEIENTYPEALEIVRQRVKPERDLVRRDANRERWWRYAEARPGLADAVSQLDHVLLQPYTAKYVMPSRYTSHCVYAHPLVVIVDARPARFACLQCSFHTLWVWAYCATNLDLIAYTANRVLETYPFPSFGKTLAEVGQQYSDFRDQLRLSQSVSLTEIYNRFHDRGEKSEDIARLRALHEEMDQAVAAAYGWSDLDLGHGFHATKQGERYTLSEPARRTVLDRLLALNHHRYAEELKAGLHEKGAKKAKAKKAKVSSGAAPQAELIPPPQQELF
jgi:hypothetical protein